MGWWTCGDNPACSSEPNLLNSPPVIPSWLLNPDEFVDKLNSASVLTLFLTYPSNVRSPGFGLYPLSSKLFNAFLDVLLSVKLSPTASLIALLSGAPSISWFLAVELVFAAPPKSPPKLVTARNRTSLPVNPPFSVAVCVRSSPYQRRLQPAFYRLCQVHLSRHPWKLQ